MTAVISVSSSTSPSIVQADDGIASELSFDRLPLAPATLANLKQLGYLRMTPIQAASLLWRWPAVT